MKKQIISVRKSYEITNIYEFVISDGCEIVTEINDEARAIKRKKNPKSRFKNLKAGDVIAVINGFGRCNEVLDSETDLYEVVDAVIEKHVKQTKKPTHARRSALVDESFNFGREEDV